MNPVDDQPERPRQPAPRDHYPLLAVLLVLTVVAIGILDAAVRASRDDAREPAHDAPAGHSDSPRPSSQWTSPPTVAAAVQVSRAALARLPRATTFTTLPAAPRDPRPATTLDGQLVRPKRTLALYDRPGGRPFAALPPRQLGGPTWVPITQTRPGWVRVLLPARPNGATGWLPRDDKNVRIARSPYRIVIDRAEFQLILYRGWIPLGIWKVGIGKPTAPTPRGRTFILAALREPNPTFSTVIVPLGAHSNTHQTYGGGPGTVGIHTWPTSDVYGQASSDGCIRVPKDALTDISTTVPIGTPVLIR